MIMLGKTLTVLLAVAFATCSALGVSNYVRWGNSSCPVGTGAALIYSGFVAGTWYGNAGGGSNFLCLPPDPEWHSYDDSLNGERARLAGGEFQTNQHGPLLDLHQTDALCSVCLVPRATTLMIPAKTTCPSGWTREYSGYLMTEKYSHHRADFICVDEGAEGEFGSEANDNGALIYHVEGRCSYNLPCPPYVNGRELTCVVCSANPK